MTSTPPAEPLVSVVMTAYNEQEQIADAIRGFLNQTYANFELLVVDDGSSDGTLEVAQSFAESDPRVRIVQLERTGRVGALNAGFGAARGDYVAVVDADDVARPDRFQKQVRFLLDNPGVSILGGACRMIDTATGKSRTWSPPLDHEAMVAYSMLGNPMPDTTRMMSREMLSALGGYREFGFRDYDFIVRAMQRFRAANLPDELVDVSVDSGGIMAQQTSWQLFRRGMACRAAAVRAFSPRLLLPWNLLRASAFMLRLIVRRKFSLNSQ